MMIRIWCGLTVLMLAPLCRSEGPAQRETRIVAYAKSIDVAQLDPAVPSELLEQWLLHGPPQLEKLDWRMSDCDLKPDGPEPADGYPLCAKFVYKRGRVGGWGIITVGTNRKGVFGAPRFEYAVVSAPDGPKMRFDRAKTLHDFPLLISKFLKETH